MGVPYVDHLHGKVSGPTYPLTAGTTAEARPVVSNRIILPLSGEDESTGDQAEDCLKGFQPAPQGPSHGKFGYALDGRVAANEEGNFDLWARPIQNSVPGKVVRIIRLLLHL